MALIDDIRAAAREGKLLDSTLRNLEVWLEGGGLPGWAVRSIEELVVGGAWEELNDRFYRDLEFGTGGLRGRTIGRVLTASERGNEGPQGSPEHPGVGSNLVNDFTVIRATVGLFRYTRGYLEADSRKAAPKLVIAHDVRHFSRFFCELAASTWTRLGGKAYIFDGPRSTPQLSFTVRQLKAQTGVVVTASHNPPHDNGYKVYFEDGGQVIPPHDAGIIGKVGEVSLADVYPHLETDLDGVTILSDAEDEAYLKAAAAGTLDAEILRESGLKVAFSNLHGTGGVSTLPLLREAGIEVRPVETQAAFDPRFPTVKSPNPENAEALAEAVSLAEKEGLDLVLAMDPDADRMAVAARGPDGRITPLTGNQTGAILAEYRIRRLKELKWIPEQGSDRCALIKTFVTSPLQDAVGAFHGLKVINTLTGFKWIAGRIAHYERKFIEAVRTERGAAPDYDELDFRERADLLQRHSTFYVFGGEESYGYLPTDTVRDKDGNAACLLCCEVAAWARSQGKTLFNLLDELYLRHGFHLEGIGQIVYEGATGAAKIRKILESYRENPPAEIGGRKVTRFEDFGRERVVDADGETVPSQDLYFVTLDNGYRYGVRGSGTEPKIKFYLFAREEVTEAGDLPDVKERTRRHLAELREQVEADAARRAGSA